MLDLETRVGRLGLMVAMTASFFMAIAVPEAYGDEGSWFAAAYFTLRVLQVVLSFHGARDEPELLRSWTALAPFFLIAPSLVLAGGLVESDGVRIGLWVTAIAVDVAGALNAGATSSASHRRTSPSGTA
jgi:low temperature requirement protein LtrA